LQITVKEKLQEDADCEIATTSLRVSLMCPLGKMRMAMPCRPSTCVHLQCFDASLFIQMNERKPTWNCPVCDKPALYDSLVIDGCVKKPKLRSWA
jgi:MIZ/SP-RING zinc finger